MYRNGHTHTYNIYHTRNLVTKEDYYDTGKIVLLTREGRLKIDNQIKNRPFEVVYLIYLRGSER